MKNKKFIVICLILIMITTISLVLTHILKQNNKETKISYEFLKDKTFIHTTKDDFGESKEVISFSKDEVTKKITIKSSNDLIDDLTNEATYIYSIKENDSKIYLNKGNLTIIYKYKNNCIYNIDNEEMKYCIEKDA